MYNTLYTFCILYHLKFSFSEKDTLKLDVKNLDGINMEVPPEQFNFDLSCNIAMVLGKKK